MKKSLAIVLTLCLFLPCIASAEDVLADGWENADLATLQEAKQALSARITQLIVHHDSIPEGYSVSSRGMTITDGYTIPAGLWRRTIIAPQAAYDDKVTLSIGGDNTTIKIDDGIVAVPISLSSSRSVDYAVVETDAEWSINYTPILSDGSISASGDGGFVSDCFTCTKPTMVTFDVKNGDTHLVNFSVRLYTISTSGHLSNEYGSELMVNELVNSGDSKSFNAIIKPEDSIAAYIWVIVCDAGVEWSITAK